MDCSSSLLCASSRCAIVFGLWEAANAAPVKRLDQQLCLMLSAANDKNRRTNKHKRMRRGRHGFVRDGGFRQTDDWMWHYCIWCCYTAYKTVISSYLPLLPVPLETTWCLSKHGKGSQRKSQRAAAGGGWYNHDEWNLTFVCFLSVFQLCRLCTNTSFCLSTLTHTHLTHCWVIELRNGKETFAEVQSADDPSCVSCSNDLLAEGQKKSEQCEWVVQGDSLKVLVWWSLIQGQDFPKIPTC